MADNGRISQSEIEILASKAFEEGVAYALVGRDSGQSESSALRGTANVVRDELEKAGVLVQKKRRARVSNSPGATLEQVRHYLPANYEARDLPNYGREGTIVIEGYDRAGWTLDGYVIPRLASGLIVATEVTY